jgi:small subunit ribosomal protein S15e
MSDKKGGDKKGGDKKGADKKGADKKEEKKDDKKGGDKKGADKKGAEKKEDKKEDKKAADKKGGDKKAAEKEEKPETEKKEQKPKPAQAVPKKRVFRKFQYRGVDLEKLFEIGTKELRELFPARARRRFSRGLSRRSRDFIKKLRKAKREAPPGDKPEPVKTHLRNTIIVPEMVGSIVGVHNGRGFTNVEIRAEMIGHYLGEFAITYKPVKHGKPGIGATHSSRFIPLK